MRAATIMIQGVIKAMKCFQTSYLRDRSVKFRIDVTGKCQGREQRKEKDFCNGRYLHCYNVLSISVRGNRDKRYRVKSRPSKSQSHWIDVTFHAYVNL